MAVKRMQNKMAESRFALSVTAVYSVIVCLACQAFQHGLWIDISCLLVSTYLITELNNANSLIRIYSRMLPSAFLALTMSANFILQNSFAMVVQLCLIVFYILFFRAYQDRNSVGKIFYSFLFLGISSVFFIQVLYFVPVIWILMKFKIMVLSWRTFFASIIGLIVPYWLIVIYFVYVGRLNTLLTHIVDIATFNKILDYSNVRESQIITFAFVFLLALIGIIHFTRTSFNDKIRTRMLYETFIIMDIFSVLLIILQPQHYNTALSVMIVNTAPLIAHFITLTKTRLTNITFYVILVATITITAYNIWAH